MRDQAPKRKLRLSARSLSWAIGCLLPLGLGLSPAGCTHTFYRNKADEEVQHVLTEKNMHPEWAIREFHVYPDPRARFADPTNPDRPPMPPDDPASYDMSPHAQKPGKA